MSVYKTVLVFGGAFDPPHNGHLYFLQNAIAAVDPDLVLVMPTGISPHKAASLTPARLRLQMCSCFLPLDGRIRICDHELRQKGKNYTIDTVAWLERRYPGARLVLAVGSDMLLHFERWHCWQQLLQHVTLCVQCRQNEDAAALQDKARQLQALGGQVVLCEQKAWEISSTQLRTMAAEGRDIIRLVPASVVHLIARHRLYQPLPDPRQVARVVRAALGKKRWRHTLGVRRAALWMARRYGADRQKAELAALLHDFLKETSGTEILRIFADHGIIDDKTDAAQDKTALPSAYDDRPAPLPGPLQGLIPADITRRPQAIWHGAAAALVAYGRFGIRDRDILSAIACHTCGRAGMTRLDKILYLADMIGPDRHFEGVDTLRGLCRQDLDAALRWALAHNAAYQRSRGEIVCPESEAALRELEEPE